MKVKVTSWKVSTLYRIKDKINAQPPYQRGEVWKDRKKALLVDSMLRGIDIPKIYLRKLDSNAYDYEVADGQQRLNAIFEFYENQFALLEDEDKGLNLKKVSNRIVGGKFYQDLPTDFQNNFASYEISVAIIEESNNHEIRILFGRLQEGEPLVPAEKRNAIISKVGSIIDNFSINHKFFQGSRISPERFKRQDFLSHGFGLIFYNNVYPLKASLLLQMYLDKEIDCSQEMQSQISDVLDMMYEIDNLCSTRIHKKYHFIDVFFFLFKKHSELSKLNANDFALKFDLFERKRLGVENPQELIVGSNLSKDNQNLFDYYMAFKFAGAEPDNIMTRYKVFNYIFKNSIGKK